eukprot:scaffold46974_cov37-Prasinocladus_malaysianus.AAC.1
MMLSSNLQEKWIKHVSTRKCTVTFKIALARQHPLTASKSHCAADIADSTPAHVYLMISLASCAQERVMIQWYITIYDLAAATHVATVYHRLLPPSIHQQASFLRHGIWMSSSIIFR